MVFDDEQMNENECVRHGIAEEERPPRRERGPKHAAGGMTGYECRQEQHQDDRDGHGRARERDQQLLAGRLGNPLEPRHAADGQQDHVRRAHPEAPRHRDVPELVEQDAEEEGDEEQRVAHGRGRAGRAQTPYAIQPSSRRKVTWTFTSVPAIRPIVYDHLMPGSFRGRRRARRLRKDITGPGRRPAEER